MQFTKLFNSILDSTIWQEPPATKICWITMLAMCDRAGDVFASVPGLANRAGVTIEDAESAIACFLSPDKYSRTKDHQGRRIAEIDGGWTLLNHGKYRALLSAEERKEYNRRKQADFRAKRQAASNPVNDMSNDVKLRNQMSAMSAHTEAEAEAEAITPQPPKGGVSAKRFQKPTIDEVDQYGKTLTPQFDRALQFCSHYESNGWKVGRNAMKDWKAAVRTWHMSDRQPNGHHSKPKNSAKTGIIENLEFPEL